MKIEIDLDHGDVDPGQVASLLWRWLGLKADAVRVVLDDGPAPAGDVADALPSVDVSRMDSVTIGTRDLARIYLEAMP